MYFSLTLNKDKINKHVNEITSCVKCIPNINSKINYIHIMFHLLINTNEIYLFIS